MKGPESQARLDETARKIAKGKDVRLICYEGEGEHGHRNILKSLVEQKLAEI